MTKMDFDSNRLSKNLAERVKELDCLYKISRIAAIHKNDIEKALTLILKEIPQGWQFPDQIAAYLSFDDQKFGNPPSSNHIQETVFQINNSVTAKLKVYYKVAPKNISNPLFLLEEQALLNQIGYEIASLIEIDIKNKKEKLINEKLRQNDRLNLLNEITAGIVKELSDPLQNILNASAKLSDSNSNQTSAIEEIVSDTNLAKEIVKKLLYFSNEIPTDLTETNLNDVINDVITLLRPHLKEKNIQLNLHLDPNLGAVTLDKIQMTQVVFNLIINAIEAMNSKGVLTVTSAGVKKDIRIKITDTGKGIAAEDLKKIFEPFHSSKTMTGSGLGLSVAQGIIQSFGGRIEVDSNLNKGTTFTIILQR